MKLTKTTIAKLRKCQIALSNLNRYLKNHYPRLHAQILKQTSFLEKFESKYPISILERLYCIEHDLSDRPKCKMCDERYVMRFIKEKNEYSKWCCPSCQASDPECIASSKRTRKEKYGDENFNNTAQARETRIEKNGGSYHAEDFVSKLKSTKKRNHGDENYVNSEKARETIDKKLEENPDFWKEREAKIKQTKVASGHDPNWNNREKYRQTCLEEYGVEWYVQSDDWRQKSEATIQKDPLHYQKRNAKTACTISQIPNFYECRNQQTRSTCLLNYGVEYWFQTDECRDLHRRSIVKKKMKLLKESEYDEPKFSFEYLLAHNADKKHRYKFKCKKCGKLFSSVILLVHGNHYHCPTCFPRRSGAERQVLNFISNLLPNQTILYRDRKMLKDQELDILIKDSNIAIEYDGLYWHSIDCDGKQLSKQYHISKTLRCKELGIQAIHIFEDEWLLDPSRIKSKLKKILDVGITHVNAHDLEVVFSNQTIHLRDPKLDCILASIAVSRSRLNIKEDQEILEYSESKDCIVDNGFERLLEEFEKKFFPRSIAMFVDLRWDDGKRFANCGFTIQKKLKPTCWWFNKSRLIERIHHAEFKKTIAPILLKEEFTGSINQISQLKKKGWMRVYDCGQLKLTKINA